MNEVFGYLRVSGKGQLDGDGFDRQRDSIHAFCDERGWKVIRFFEEKAVSGKTEMEDREAFMEMLGLCGGVLPRTIVVERADRVARDLIVGELLYSECAKLNVELFAADSGEEMVMADKDPTRKLIRQVLGALSEWSKSELVLKMRKARERIRAEKGRCEGVKPYEITHPEAHAKVVEFIGCSRSRGDSWHRITSQLNVTGFKSPKGGRWNSSTIHKLYARHLHNA